ncbi:MAG: hypothetical protein V4515_13370 [Chloroflexota bacterium]
MSELWTFLAIALPVLAALLATIPTVDLAYQLRAGAEILGGQGIPTVDSWTFTAAGMPWLDQQWAAQVILAAIHGAFGWTGLAMFRAALVGCISGLILAAIRARAPDLPPRTAALLGLSAFVVMAPALALRPQLLGMALFALVLAILALRRSRPWLVWTLPIVALVWANLHGSFVLAPVLVGLAWLDDAANRSPRARTTGLVTFATMLATVGTPSGIGAWRYAAGLATNREITAQISEWQPPALTDVPGLLFWGSVVLVAVSAVVLVRRRDRLAWPGLLGLIAFAALGAIAARGIAWWPGVAVVTIAGLAAQPDAADRTSTTARPLARGNRLNALLGAGLLTAGIALVPAWRPVDRGLEAPSGLLDQAPSGITASLRAIATPADRVWNPQIWGSWLEFAVPAPSYALDSRIEVIPAQVWVDAALVAAAAAGWPGVLDRAGVTIVVTEGSASRLASALAASSGWAVAFADADGAVWIRSLHRSRSPGIP